MSNAPRRRWTWLTREVFGWSMFDFANQAFTMVIITVMYQVYFINFVVPASEGGGNELGKRLWETSTIIGEIFIIAIAPLAGALADFSGAKKRFLFLTYLGCVIFTFALGLVAPGQVALGMIFFIIGYIFFASGENFLNAFLPEITDHRHMGRVSAFSWTIAYTGSLISMAVAVLITQLVDGPAGYRLVCVWCGIYFLLGGIPTFLLLRERKLAEALPQGQSIYTVGFARLGQTFRDMKRYRQLLRFLGISAIYISGMQIVVFYAGSITKELFNFDELKQGLFMLQVIVTGIVGAAVTGRVQDRIGTRLTIQILLAVWAITMLLAALSTREWIFWLTGNLVGFSMGALGTSSRVMAGLFSPQHKAAEFFGFYGMAHKFAVILGMGFQFVLGLAGASYRGAIGASSIFFIIGLLLMFTINEKEGRVVALRSAREHIRRHKDYVGQIAGDTT
jgi:UMF1 family MFS transporter